MWLSMGLKRKVRAVSPAAGANVRVFLTVR